MTRRSWVQVSPSPPQLHFGSQASFKIYATALFNAATYEISPMEIEITAHAKKRMSGYFISEELLHNTIEKPDSVVDGYGGRRVYQKKLDGYVLRIIIEEHKGV